MKYQEFQDRFSIYFRSPLMKEVVDVIYQIAPTDIPVLIYGESGTGKELIANALHNLSKRADKKMFSVNCGAIPEGLIESELFGHQKGAFTGAIESRKGYFELADKGTLFLDELAELPLQLQVKFLRVLETQEILKVGAEVVTKIDVRFITATNKRLSEEVQKKRFREDLFFRLNSVTIEIPPLRKRKEDIPILVNRFLADFYERNKIEKIEIEPDALEYLIEYNWPGNIRELKNIIETAAALSKENKLKIIDFEKIINVNSNINVSRNLPVTLGISKEEADIEWIKRALMILKNDLDEIKNLIHENKDLDKGKDEKVIIYEEPRGQKLKIDEINKAMIENNFDKKKVAEALNISLRTLYRKLNEIKKNHK